MSDPTPAPEILALDIATVTGWAIRRSGDRLIHGSHRVALGGADLGATFHKFDLWLSDMLTVHDPGLVVFEAPIPQISTGNGFQTARKLLGLAAVCEMVCYRRGVAVREASVSTVRKHFCGSGRADKDAVGARCLQLGHDPTDHNAADAIALWYYTVGEIERRRSQPRLSLVR